MIASLRGVSESPLCMDMPRLRVKPDISRNFYRQETYSIIRCVFPEAIAAPCRQLMRAGSTHLHQCPMLGEASVEANLSTSSICCSSRINFKEAER